MEKSCSSRRRVTAGVFGSSLLAVVLAVSIPSCGRLTTGTRGSGSTAPVGVYIAPNGNDNNPGTLSAPVQTLEKARGSDAGVGTMKTAYLRAGMYPRTALLTLTRADDGETWRYYPPDGVDTAILDGGSRGSHTGVDVILIQGGSNITINGLEIQNFDNYAIAVHGGAAFEDQFPASDAVASGNIIINNVLHDGYTWHTSGWAGGGVWAEGQVTNLRVKNNVVYNQYGSAIRGCANPDGNLPTTT